MKKRTINLCLLLLAAALPLSAQSRTNRLYRPCPASATPASVAISSVGAITLTPCSGQSITQTTSGTATFNSPIIVLGNDPDSYIDINNLLANTIRIGNPSSSAGGQLFVGMTNGFNSWVVPATQKLQLGAANAGSAAGLYLNRATQTASLYANIFDWSGATSGPTIWNLRRTVTAGGTTGNQTIDLINGTVNFAAAATTITVTNSTVSATSQIIVTPQRLDATCKTFVVDAKGAGTFNIVATAACTAETSVAFWVTN